MIRHWLLRSDKKSRASRRRPRGRRSWGPEGLEGRLLLSGPTLYTVNATTDTGPPLTGTGSGNTGDLRYVIDQANNQAKSDPNPDGSLITFSPAVFDTSRIIILSSSLELSETDGPEVIDGPGTGVVDINGIAEINVEISGNNKVRDFRVDSGVAATLSLLTIANGSDADYGGGIDNEGTLRVAGCTLSSNSAGSAGYGGGIENDGTTTLNGCTLSNNSAGIGGGINNDDMITLNGCTLSNNSAAYYGAGIENKGTTTLAVCILANNSAGYDGGGIENDDKTTVTGCTLAHNSAGNDGGGIVTEGGPLTVTGCTFADNTAGVAGGGIASYDALTVTGSTLENNSASNHGGGIDNDDASALTVTGSTLADNSAGYGGGIYNHGAMTAVNVTITGNQALGNGLPPVSGAIRGVGGGLDNDGSGATLDNTIVALNAVVFGGVVPDDIDGPKTVTGWSNLIGIGGAGGLTEGIDGNQVGVVDPGLGVLGDNGGPTQTIPLLTDSPAVGTGSTSLAVDPSTGRPLTTDQRGAGFVRQFDDVVDIGAYELQPHLGVTSEPPGSVASDSPFPITVAIFKQSGLVDTGFDGNVTLALVNPGGATLGGTLTVAAHEGVASFSGLTIDRGGTYRIMASTDPAITALTTPVAVAGPSTIVVGPPTIVAGLPTIVAEKALFAGKGRHRRVVGYELDFSAALDPARATSLADYELSQTLRHGRRVIAQPVAFGATYDAAARSVTLTLAGRPKFIKGGRLVVVAAPGGLTDATGVALDGGNLGMPGDDGTFVIARKGAAISR